MTDEDRSADPLHPNAEYEIDHRVAVRTGRERFRTRVEVRGHVFSADEPAELGGTDLGPTPTTCSVLRWGRVRRSPCGCTPTGRAGRWSRWRRGWRTSGRRGRAGRGMRGTPSP